MWPAIWNILDHWLYGPRSQRANPLALLLRLARYPLAVIRDLIRGEINLRAMGLVYATLLSTIPLLAFTFAILKGFGAHRTLRPVIYEFFRPIGAGADELTARVMEFADNVSSGLVGSIGFLLLLWTLIGTIRRVEDSFNFLWQVELPRSFARRIAEYLGLIILGPALLVAFIGLTGAALRIPGVQYLSRLPLADRLFAFALVVSPYATVTAIFTVLYMLVPNTRVRWRPALIGALASGVLWAAVGKLFTTLVVDSTRLMIVYAGFAIIVAALLWTYFGWLILLAGTRLSFYIQNPAYLRLGLEELRLSAVELENLALKLMYLVGRSHATGRERWSGDKLSAALALPGIAVAAMVHGLEKARLLTVAADGSLLPARDIGQISVLEILDVARSAGSGHLVAQPLVLPAVERLGARLDAAQRASLAGRTLRELVEEPD